MNSAITESVMSFVLEHWWFIISHGIFFLAGAGWYRYMLKTNPAKLATLVAETTAVLQPIGNAVKPVEQAVVSSAETAVASATSAVSDAVNSAVTNTVTTAVADVEKKL